MQLGLCGQLPQENIMSHSESNGGQRVASDASAELPVGWPTLGTQPQEDCPQQAVLEAQQAE
jgi:hypothetical protein